MARLGRLAGSWKANNFGKLWSSARVSTGGGRGGLTFMAWWTGAGLVGLVAWRVEGGHYIRT